MTILSPKFLVIFSLFVFFNLSISDGASLEMKELNSRSDSSITKTISFVEDFEKGYTNGWESYPPFQDTGFDPNFYCRKIKGPDKSQYSLMVEYSPTFVTEYEMGFIKQLSLIANDNSTVSFFYKAEGYGDFKDLHVTIYGENKEQYFFNAAIENNNEWIYLEIPMRNFSGTIKNGTKINGFSVTTKILKTNTDLTYRLYLDNLKINAQELVRFQVEEPSSVYLESSGFTIPLHHYSLGDVLDLSLKLPEGINLKYVFVDLLNPGMNFVLRDIPLEYDLYKQVWTAKNIYEFLGNDSLGRWTIEINGKNEEEKEIYDKFNIWVSNKNQTHPRLYYYPKDIAELKEKTYSEHWEKWWNNLVNENESIRKTSKIDAIKFGAETSSLTEIPSIQLGLKALSNIDLSVYDTVYLLPTLHHYFNILQPVEKILQENALIYLLTGDAAVGEYVKQVLMIISGWKTWTHPWFVNRNRDTYYPVGELGIRAAFCYDVVYNLMTDQERKKVAEGLLRNCIIPAYNEYVLGNRVPSCTSNWVSNVISGGISCILAIYGDNPDVSGDCEPYLSGLINKFEDNIYRSLDTTGAWGEGIGYQGFAFCNLLPTISAVKNVLKYDYSNQGILNSYKYFLYNYSNPEILEVGDSHPQLTTLSNFAWLSSHSGDPVFQWLYMQSPRENIFDFMFGSNDKKIEQPNSLPESILFPDLGGAIFRSGWSEKDIVLNFRSGPFYNHQHIDQGNILINAFGECLLPEAGGANYYNDPWYSRYNIQPAGHNTILLDGDCGSQKTGDYLHFIEAADKRARVTDFIDSDFYSAATGDLTDVYRGKLDICKRNIIFVNKKYFIVYDKIKSSSIEHEYDLLFHFDDENEVKVDSQNSFLFDKGKAVLASKIFFPEKINLDIVETAVKLGVPIKKPGYVQVSNSQKSMEENFITVLYPAQKNSGTLDFLEGIKRIKSDNYIGLNVKDKNSTSTFLFKTKGAEIKSGSINTDADIICVMLNDNELQNFRAHNTSYFTYGRNVLLKADSHVTFASTINSTSSVWEINAQDDCEVVFYLSTVPNAVTWNNKKLDEDKYSFNDNMLSISLSKGNNSIIIDN